MGQPEGQYAYKAFISYSHRDTAWAKWLLGALEGYRLPAYLRDHVGRRRGVGRIYRDRDEASAATDLKEEIQQALFSSEHLIVIASPNSARSQYVEAEIEAFAEHNLTRVVPGRILTVIVKGEPNISPPGGEMAPAECFPPALRGGLRKPDGTSVEPLAADARHTGDGKTRALAKLVSGLLNVRYDSLVRRDLQRRRWAQVLAGIGVVVALGIAGAGVALRLAEQGAQRSFRTVTAVNNAERARRQLAKGDLEGAVALARTSLPDDSSLPFVPQAYGVLYGALYQAQEPRTVDLGQFDESGQTFEMAGGQFFSVDDFGKATVWSPTRGVIFTRNDLDHKPATMSPDRSVVFVQPISAMLRYHAGTGHWDKIDPNGFYSEDPNILESSASGPDAYVAIDANTLAGCSGPIMRIISIPEGDGTASLLWTRKFDGFLCNVVEATPQGTLMVSNSERKLFEIDVKTHQSVHEYEIGDTSILWSRTVGDVVVVGSIGATHVFSRQNARLMLSFKDATDASAVSVSGRYILEPGILSGSRGIVIHDLKTGSAVRPNCANCTVIGFLDEATVLARSANQQQVLAFDAGTGAAKTGVFTFPQRVDKIKIFADSKTLLGIRFSSESLVTTLGQRRIESAVVTGQPGRSTVAAKFAGPNTLVSEQTDGSNSVPLKVSIHLYRAAVGGEEIVAPELNSPTSYSELARLPHGLFSVFAPNNIGETMGTYRIFDADSGKLVLKKMITARPVSFGADRYVLLSEAEDFGVFDLENRRFQPIAAGTGAGTGVAWSINGNYLATAVGAEIRIFSLDENGAKPMATLKNSAPPANICVTPDGKYIYAVDYTVDPPILERISISSSKEDARIRIDYRGEGGRELSLILLDTMVAGAMKLPSLVCDDGRAVIRDEVAQLAAVWGPSNKDQKMAILPLAKADPPEPADGDGGNESLTANQIDSVLFTSSETRLSFRDPITQQPLMTIIPEASRIASAAWVPSRGLVAAGLDNGRLQVWDATSASAPMIDLVAHGEPIEMLDASVDGKWLLTAGRGGTINLWPLFSTAELLKKSDRRHVE